MKRNKSTAISAGLVALMSLMILARVSMAQTDAASTNAIQRPDAQAVIYLEQSGQLDQAEARCMQILQKNPGDPDAKRLLAEIEDAKHQHSPSTSLRLTLEETIIPEVNVRDAAVGDVIEVLQAEGQKALGAATPMNIVWEAPDGAKSAKVTLNLHSVPLADALKYVTEGAGLRYRVDPHAVVIYQPGPATPADFSTVNVKSP
ncbi:MAG TPA: STN domain-containing protein [Verrucomicrobiae bacterium]|nr:STN domain-containing protein [Verrucomicrobiae bacterium]